MIQAAAHLVLFGTLVAGAPVLDRVGRKSGYQKVVNGQDAPEDRYPWVVGLDAKVKGEIYSCGGSLIAPGYVLTAAHCFFPSNGKAAGTAYFGAHETCFYGDCNAEERKIVKAIIHPNYNDKTSANDVAILVLASPINTIEPVPIKTVAYAKQDTFSKGSEQAAMTFGWGVVNEKTETMGKVLQQGNVNLVSRNTCGTGYKYGASEIKAGMVCSNHPKGTDACQGDSGGPLFSASRGELVGVVSWGQGCGKKNYPGVYADVGYYHSWITSITGSLNGGGGVTDAPATDAPVTDAPATTKPPAAVTTTKQPDGGGAASYSNVLFAGDSDVEGWDTAETFPGSTNVGVGGWTCNKVLKKMDGYLKTHKPEWVVVVCGENDLNYGTSVNTAFGRFSEIVDKVTAAGARVLYMGTKPEPATKKLHAKYQQYDAKLRALAATHSANSRSGPLPPFVVVDVFEGFQALGNGNNLYKNDKLHLSAKGYSHWNEWAGQALGVEAGALISNCLQWRSGTCMARGTAAPVTTVTSVTSQTSSPPASTDAPATDACVCRDKWSYEPTPFAGYETFQGCAETDGEHWCFTTAECAGSTPSDLFAGWHWAGCEPEPTAVDTCSGQKKNACKKDSACKWKRGQCNMLPEAGSCAAAANNKQCSKANNNGCDWVGQQCVDALVCEDSTSKCCPKNKNKCNKDYDCEFHRNSQCMPMPIGGDYGYYTYDGYEY